jgi:hypothetical protein
MTRSECIFKNFRNQIVNAVHNFWAFCERSRHAPVSRQLERKEKNNKKRQFR